MATLYANLGVIHYSRSNYIKALEYYMQSSEIREKIGDTKGIASINSKIGLIYNEQEEYFKAIQHLRKSYNLFKKLNDKRSMAKTLINIGNNYKSLDSAQKAINHYNRSLEISNEIKNRRLIAANLSNLGTEYLYRDKRDKAMEALQKALAINKQLGRKDNVANSLSNMGYFYYETGDIRKAIEYYKEVVKLENEIGTISESEQAYSMLSNCYAKLGNYKKAWNYQNNHIAIKDSIFQKEKQEKMEEMKARYESKQKEKEIALLKKDKKLQRAKLKSNKTLRNFTILIALLILFFGIIYFIRFKKTVRLTRQLREKNKEVEKQKEEIALQSSNLKEINNLLKEKNKQIEDQRQYLEDLNNTKDRMFSIIAHDLKSPTATLKSTFELLLKKDINDQEKIHQFHTLLYDNVTSLYNLMDNLLMWAKNQQKEVNFNPELQNLTDLIENNIRVLKITADNKGVQIINNSNPAIMACFDKNMISTVIRNLLSNAVKFTPSSGKVYVNTLESNNTIEVTIKDTGIGINKEAMEKILNTENHYSTNGTNKERGSGLGISICKRFIESHGSKLEVESAVEKGSTFRFKLPVNLSF
jgi:signal transduction histidine kinase